MRTRAHTFCPPFSRLRTARSSRRAWLLTSRPCKRPRQQKRKRDDAADARVQKARDRAIALGKPAPHPKRGKKQPGKSSGADVASVEKPIAPQTMSEDGTFHDTLWVDDILNTINVAVESVPDEDVLMDMVLKELRTALCFVFGVDMPQDPDPPAPASTPHGKKRKNAEVSISFKCHTTPQPPHSVRCR